GVGVALAGWLGPRLGTISLLNAQGAGYIVMGLLLLALLAPPTPTPAAEQVAVGSGGALTPIPLPPGEGLSESPLAR
ncbi:MAG TPA: hypothetical protein VIC27_02640, partial [Ktedonobacterales bacterium]